RRSATRRPSGAPAWLPMQWGDSGEPFSTALPACTGRACGAFTSSSAGARGTACPSDGVARAPDRPLVDAQSRRALHFRQRWISLVGLLRVTLGPLRNERSAPIRFDFTLPRRSGVHEA